MAVAANRRWTCFALAILVTTHDHLFTNSSISIAKAKPQLCRLVDDARDGQTHIITVHDKPVAQIGPVESTARRLAEEWRERMKREDIRLNRSGKKRVTISELIQRERK